jgi:cytochrome P460
MKRYLAIAAVAALSAAIAITCVAIDGAGAQETSQASPIYDVTIPDGYRHWELIAPALEGDPLDELRAVVGNAVALDAYRKGTLPFPDGSVLVKLAWKRTQSAEFESASVPGAATTVQVMVKDSKKYASSGGWGFGRFIDGKPADLAQHETCFACHEARVQNHNYVFTRYAP